MRIATGAVASSGGNSIAARYDVLPNAQTHGEVWLPVRFNDALHRHGGSDAKIVGFLLGGHRGRRLPVGQVAQRKRPEKREDRRSLWQKQGAQTPARTASGVARRAFPVKNCFT